MRISNGFAVSTQRFVAGDFPSLQRELGADARFPNVVADPAMGACLTYAIYNSPIALVGALLEAGADPNWPDDDGFPPLIAAQGGSRLPPRLVRTRDRNRVQVMLAASRFRSGFCAPGFRGGFWPVVEAG
jgi:hypothetical protein